MLKGLRWYKVLDSRRPLTALRRKVETSFSIFFPRASGKVHYVHTAYRYSSEHTLYHLLVLLLALFSFFSHVLEIRQGNGGYRFYSIISIYLV